MVAMIVLGVATIILGINIGLGESILRPFAIPTAIVGLVIIIFAIAAKEASLMLADISDTAIYESHKNEQIRTNSDSATMLTELL